MSTPSAHQREREKKREEKNEPVMVPCTTDPFLSSTVTVSLFSFIKNLSGRLAGDPESATARVEPNELHGEKSKS